MMADKRVRYLHGTTRAEHRLLSQTLTAFLSDDRLKLTALILLKLLINIRRRCLETYIALLSP